MKNRLTTNPPKGWCYCGDLSLEYGGYFYKLTEWGYADVIEVIPCSDAGCQDNAWWISQGTRTTDVRDENLVSALACLDFDVEVTDAVKVEALMAYAGFERDCQEVLQIGPDDPYARDYVEPTIKRRAGSDLENFVRKWANWE